MTCRAPSSLTTTCSGSPITGAQLGYDSEGRLVSWQNLPTAPTSSAAYLYDGEGRRVESQVSVSGTTTTTVYAGRLEEVAATGGTTTSTSYYDLGGAGFGVSINGAAPSYLATDHLGSPAVTLDGSGNLTGSQLYAAYGTSAYTSGSMPGSYGYTGQHSDTATTGLDYYGARYYDPVAAQFTSADTVRDGQSRFGYVAGNPETFRDPSGHECMAGPYDCGGEPIAGREGSGSGGWGGDPQDPSAGPGPNDPGTGGDTGGSTPPGNGGNDGNNSGPNAGNSGDGGSQGGPTSPGDPGSGTSGGNTTGSGTGISSGSPAEPPTATSPAPPPSVTEPPQLGPTSPTVDPQGLDSGGDADGTQPVGGSWLVNDTAQLNADDQGYYIDANGPGAATPTAGSVVMEGEIDGEPFEVAKTGFKGINYGEGWHAEFRASGEASRTALSLAKGGSTGELRVTVITANEPCPSCEAHFPGWEAQMQRAAGPGINIRMRVLWYSVDGEWAIRYPLPH